MLDRDAALLQAAFRDIHGQRLHGFALLVTLGNQSIAAATASRALREGAAQATELRHPERAAAWLRTRVMRLLPPEPGRMTRATEADRRASLRALGVTDEVFGALASLRTVERATLVATAIEGLDERDVETIVGIRGHALRTAIRRARTTYIAAASAAMPPGGGASQTLPGSLTASIEDQARRTLGGRETR